MKNTSAQRKVNLFPKNWMRIFCNIVICFTILGSCYIAVRNWNCFTSNAMVQENENPVQEEGLIEDDSSTEDEIYEETPQAAAQPFINQVKLERQHIELWNRLYVATMMAHEACEETCAKREAIGFMNRIDHPYTGCHTPREVFYSGAYDGCETAIPTEVEFEWATEVIEAYNSDYWEEYCASFGLTNRVIFHHNGDQAKYFEWPRYIEYGCSEYGYRWTMLYSEHVDYHY